jgi:XTP/dITP diphosphohydrolase
MKDLIFATQNAHKLSEIQSLFEEEDPRFIEKFNLISLKDLNFSGDIPEEEETLEGNAMAKARFVYERYGKDCFADDTGLEIDALDGRPGVYAARYAGEGCSFDDNINKVLMEMQSMEIRTACFRTVIALIYEGHEYLFTGEVSGTILKEKHGDTGFGYDPIFLPEDSDLSFAEMNMEEKNTISHRGEAFRALSGFLFIFEGDN